MEEKTFDMFLCVTVKSDYAETDQQVSFPNSQNSSTSFTPIISSVHSVKSNLDNMNTTMAQSEVKCVPSTPAPLAPLLPTPVPRTPVQSISAQSAPVSTTAHQSTTVCTKGLSTHRASTNNSSAVNLWWFNYSIISTWNINSTVSISIAVSLREIISCTVSARIAISCSIKSSASCSIDYSATKSCAIKAVAINFSSTHLAKKSPDATGSAHSMSRKSSVPSSSKAKEHSAESDPTKFIKSTIIVDTEDKQVGNTFALQLKHDEGDEQAHKTSSKTMTRTTKVDQPNLEPEEDDGDTCILEMTCSEVDKYASEEGGQNKRVEIQVPDETADDSTWRLYKCAKCKKTFTAMLLLELHQQVYHKPRESHQKNLDFECDVCGERHEDKKNYQLH